MNTLSTTTLLVALTLLTACQAPAPQKAAPSPRSAAAGGGSGDFKVSSMNVTATSVTVTGTRADGTRATGTGRNATEAMNNARAGGSAPASTPSPQRVATAPAPSRASQGKSAEDLANERRIRDLIKKGQFPGYTPGDSVSYSTGSGLKRFTP